MVMEAACKKHCANLDTLMDSLLGFLYQSVSNSYHTGSYVLSRIHKVILYITDGEA